MKPVIVESPFAGCRPLNVAYLQACIRDCLRRGETPYASHQMLTWALDDSDPEQRELGIRAGLAMRDELGFHDAMSAFYVDLGWSSGMKLAREGVGMWDNRTIAPGAWVRVLDEACTASVHFHRARADTVPGTIGATSELDAVLRARDLYLERRAVPA